MLTMDMKKLDRTCLIVVTVVSVVCGCWVVNLGLTQQRQIRQENELLSERLQDLNLAEANLQRIKTVLDATRREIAFLNERIPESAKLGEFLKRIDSLVRERNIKLISLEPQPAVEERRYTKIPIRLTFKGTFLNVLRLVRDLETANRLVVMEEVTIAKGATDEQCRVDLTASVFER